MTLLRNTGKMVWAMFILIFLAAFQLVLLYLFGGSIIAVDMFLNLLTTNTGEVSELLSSLIPAVAMVAVIYLPILYFAIRGAFDKSYRLADRFIVRFRQWGTACLALGLISLAGCYSTEEYQASDDLYPVNVGYNIGLAVERTCRTARYADTSAGFIYDARTTHPDSCREVYILVIGETARADNFSLFGYSLPHSATSQWNSSGTYVDRSDLQPGDLVLFCDPSRSGGKACSHVGIYIGDNNFVHASSGSSGKYVRTSSLNESYYSGYYVGAKRVA